MWCSVFSVVCCPPASLGRLHSCITFHLSSLLDRVSAASSFSRAGPGAGPRGQQLIGLRKALYRALRSAFRASRRATCHMLKTYPLPEITGSGCCYQWILYFHVLQAFRSLNLDSFFSSFSGFQYLNVLYCTHNWVYHFHQSVVTYLREMWLSLTVEALMVWVEIPKIPLMTVKATALND